MKGKARYPPQTWPCGAYVQGEECNEQTAIMSVQCYVRSSDFAVGPVDPESSVDVVACRVRLGNRRHFAVQKRTRSMLLSRT